MYYEVDGKNPTISPLQSIILYLCTLSLSVLIILDLATSSTESYSKQAQCLKRLHSTRTKEEHYSTPQRNQKQCYLQPEGNIIPAHQDTVITCHLPLLRTTQSLQVSSKSIFRPQILRKLHSCGHLYLKRQEVLKIGLPLQNHQLQSTKQSVRFLQFA
jgi:hypothetical protein